MKTSKARALFNDVEPGTLVAVSWVDAFSIDDYTDVTEVLRDKHLDTGLPSISVGFLIRAGRRTVAIAGSVNANPHVAHVMVIPLAWITAVEEYACASI